MPCLVVGDLNPIVAETLRHIGPESGYDVPGEVDGVQLDMGERVKQRRPPGGAAAFPAWRHVAGGQKFRLYQGQYSTGTVLTTLTASVSNGSWSVQPGTALNDGTYTVQADQPAGAATGTSVPVTFTVDSTSTPADTAAPEVAVSSPTDGATVDTATPSVEGTAGTAAGDDATVELDLWSGTDTSGTPAQTLTGSVESDGSWSVTTDALEDGTYTVRAGQSDTAGNTGRSAPVTFTVATTVADTTAPEVSITTPSTGAAVSSAGWSVSGTGGTAQGDEPSVTLDVFSGTATSGAPVSSTSATVTRRYQRL